MQKEVKNLINWRELSRQLAGKDRKYPLRHNTIPKIHQDKVNILVTYIEAWLNDKELILKEYSDKEKKETLKEFKAKIDKIYTNM